MTEAQDPEDGGFGRSELAGRLARGLAEPAIPAEPPVPPPPTTTTPPVVPRRVPGDAALRVADRILAAAEGRPAARRSRAVVAGPGFRVELADGEELIIGRGDAGDGRVRLASGEVSRSHLSVALSGGRLVAVDLHSTNGTRRRRGETDEQLTPGVSTPLASGDLLRVFDDVELLVVEEIDEGAT